MERRTELRLLTDAEIQAVVSEGLPGAHVRRAQLTSGGRANTNYRIDLGQGCCVLRIHRAHALGEKEQAILVKVACLPVPVPRVLGRGTLPAPPHEAYSLLEFMQGERLDALVLRGGAANTARAGRAVGLVLSALVGVRFDAPGDLRSDGGGDLAVTPWPFSNYFEYCLFGTPAGMRLGPLRDALWAFLNEAGRDFSDSLPTHLVHGDLNPGNVLLHEDGTLSAVLDWEFAHAGKLWSDLGNLLRQRADCPLPPEFALSVVEGIQEGGVQLPSNWRKLSLFTDLTSACEFLSSPEDRPVIHANAIAQIRATLAELSPSQP